MTKFSTSHCMGYEVFTGNLNSIIPKNKIIINTVNQYSYCMGEKDSQFKKVLNDSDILLPDGIGIVLAFKFLKAKTIKKIAGADIHNYLLHYLNEHHGKCFYMGASNSTLTKISERLSIEYPNIKVGTYSPPYKPEFSKVENDEIINTVNNFNPDVLFVGMTAPKQEKWSWTHKEALNINGPICSIGAVFDFYAGTVSRPNTIWQNLGLEWMGRLLKEPKRMWKRYIYYGAIFGGYLIKAKIKRPSFE